MREALDWLCAHPTVDVNVCTPVTRYNLTDIEEVLSASEFDSAKHLRHSRSWKKKEPPAVLAATLPEFPAELLAVSAGG